MKRYAVTLIVVLASLVLVTFAADWNVRFIEEKFINDEFNDVAVSGNYAYFASSYGLVVMDIADQDEPQIIDRKRIKGECKFVAILDTLLFTDDENGIGVYNISNPPNVNLITIIESNGTITYIEDTLLYVSDRYFKIINVADIFNPVALDSVQHPGFKDVYINDGLLCARTMRGLYTLNVSDPRNIVELSAIDLPIDLDLTGDIATLAVHNGFIYLKAGLDFAILSIGEDGIPNLEQVYMHGRYPANESFIYNDMLVLCDDNYTCYSIENPLVPELITEAGEFENGIVEFTVYDDLVISIHNETGSFSISSFDNRNRLDIQYYCPFRYAHGSFITFENFMYMNVPNEGGKFRIYDIEHPLNPVLLDSVDIDYHGGQSRSSAGFISVDEDYLIFSDQFSYRDTVLNRTRTFRGYMVFSMEDPSAPVENFRLYMASKQGIIIDGDIMYVAVHCFDYGIHIYSLEDPRNPRLVRTIEEHGSCNKLVIQDDLLITHWTHSTPNHYDAIVIYDKTDPENPEQLGIAYNWDEYFTVYNNHIYIEENNFMYCLSFEDPTQIETINWENMGENSYGIKNFDDRLARCSSINNYFEVNNVVDPINWQPVGRIDFENRLYSSNFQLAGTIGYGKHASCILMYDFSDALNLWYLTPSEEFHDFGEVPVDSSAVWSVSMENRSQSVREISSVNINNLSFQCEPLFDVSVEPGESIDLNVTFCPRLDTNYTAVLNIQSADMTREIQLSGTGFEFNNVDEKEIIPPYMFAITSAYPNPFNSVTRIGYQLPSPSEMSIRVFDIAGREIVTLVDGTQPAGRHSAIWDASSMATGVFFVKMECAEFSSVRKVVLVR